MADFIQELKHDHAVIQQVVAGMSAVADLLDSGKQVDPSIFGGRRRQRPTLRTRWS